MQISGSSSSSYQYYQEQLKQKRQQQSTESTESGAAELFSKIDSDGSSGISASEFSSYMSQTVGTQKPEGAGAVGGPPPGPPPAGGPPPGASLSDDELESLFTNADEDGDGVLSTEEFSVLEEQLRSSAPPPNGAPPPNAAGGQTVNEDLLSELSSTAEYDYESLSAPSGSLFSAALNALGNSSPSESAMSAYMQNMLKETYGV